MRAQREPELMPGQYRRDDAARHLCGHLDSAGAQTMKVPITLAGYEYEVIVVKKDAALTKCPYCAHVLEPDGTCLACAWAYKH